MRFLRGFFVLFLVWVILSIFTSETLAQFPDLTLKEKELLKAHSFISTRAVRWPDNTKIYIYDETEFKDLEMIIDVFNDFFYKDTDSGIVLIKTDNESRAQIEILWDNEILDKEDAAQTFTLVSPDGIITEAKIYISKSVLLFSQIKEFREILLKMIESNLDREVINKYPLIVYSIEKAFLLYLDRARMIILYLHELCHALGFNGHSDEGIMRIFPRLEDFNIFQTSLYINGEKIDQSFSSRIQIKAKPKKDAFLWPYIKIEIEDVIFDPYTFYFFKILYNLPAGISISRSLRPAKY